MSRKKSNTASLVDAFFSFIRENPKLAATLAFEMGSLAGNVVGNSTETRKTIKRQVKKVPQAISDAMPPRLSNALKFLPAPKIQPRKRTQTKRPSRKTRDAA